MNGHEFRVIVKTTDTREGVVDRLGEIVRRALGREFSPDVLYVERVVDHDPRFVPHVVA